MAREFPQRPAVLRKLVIAFRVRADALLFAPDEREPQDDDLRLHIEAAADLDPDKLAAVKTVLEGIFLKHQARRVSAHSVG